MPRFVKIILACRGAQEKACQDALTDVHRIKLLSQGRVGQTGPHGDANVHLLLPDQFVSGVRFAQAHPSQQFYERFGLGHGDILNSVECSPGIERTSRRLVSMRIRAFLGFGRQTADDFLEYFSNAG